MSTKEYPLLATSYSSDNIFKSCPRKYELYKVLKVAPMLQREGTIHTALGSAVGAGLASLLTEPDNLHLAYHLAYCAWDTDVLLWEKLEVKSFPAALEALKQYQYKAQALRDAGWVVAEINGKPATEVDFRINFKGYGYFVGFIDAVMLHEPTGKLMVIEAKTMNAHFHEAKFMHSKQDIAYLLVGTAIGNFDAEVYYPVCSLVEDRVSWTHATYERTQKDLDELVLTIGLSFKYKRMMQEAGCFPRDHSSCLSFSRLCPMYGDCHKVIKAKDNTITEELPEASIEIELDID